MAINRNTYIGPSFSIRNRLARTVWAFFYWVLFYPSPRLFHSWRILILRCFGAKIGKGVHVYPTAKIWAPWNLSIASEACVAGGAILYSQGPIRIGYRSIISQGVHLCTGTHDYETTGHPLVTYPISIGSYVWLCAECFVHPGVCIGDGVVVGARSVVTCDLPEWSVCAGMPCKFVKLRKWRPS